MAEPSVPVLVRGPRTAADWQAVRTLCCQTGNGGSPIERVRWPLFADLWIGPYQRLIPKWTYVAADESRIVGYLTGCPDTAAFRRARRFRVTLPLLVKIASGRYGWTSDARRTVRLALRLGQGVESRLAPRLPAGFAHTHPAHLHMNVDAGYRRRGVGALLIERYTRDLGEAGVPGVHLFCGAEPRPFYARNGFTDLAALELASGLAVYVMGRRLGG